MNATQSKASNPSSAKRNGTGANRTSMANPNRLAPGEVRNICASLPIGRNAEPDEIARVNLFLASDESSYMCGAELAVDGGMTAGQYLAFLAPLVEPGHASR